MPKKLPDVQPTKPPALTYAGKPSAAPKQRESATRTNKFGGVEARMNLWIKLEFVRELEALGRVEQVGKTELVERAIEQFLERRRRAEASSASKRQS